MSAAVAAPPAIYNFAADLFARNAARASRLAYADDHGHLTYGELERQSRGLAAALLAAGVRRDERVLLAMQDNNLWPVSFLGCLFAGVVPVAVNTLLTADDYGYMLAHSRAQLVLASSRALPALQAAMAASPHEVRELWVAQPSAPLARGEADLAQRINAADALSKPAATAGDEPAFWLYSSGSTGRPKGTVHTHANLYWTAELYGRGVLGLQRTRRLLLGGQAVLRLRPGQCAHVPAVGRRIDGADGRAAHARRGVQALDGGAGGPKPTLFFGAPTGYAGMLVSPSAARSAARWRCACARRPARRCRANSASASARTSAAS